MEIIETIKHFKLDQTKGPILIMLRHAEKEPLFDDLKDSERSITKLGEKHSSYLGKVLRDVNVSLEFVKTSPLLRCVNTGYAILNEDNNKTRLIHSNYLGDPGAYIKDSQLAEEIFNCYSVEEVVEKLLKDQLLPGFYNKQLGTSVLLKELRYDLEHLVGFGLYITHDAILAPFVGTFTNQFITKENWFGFLEGVCIKKRSDDELELYWGTQKHIMHSGKRCLG